MGSLNPLAKALGEKFVEACFEDLVLSGCDIVTESMEGNSLAINGGERSPGVIIAGLAHGANTYIGLMALGHDKGVMGIVGKQGANARSHKWGVVMAGKA